MKDFTRWIMAWLYLMIPGFIYLLAIFFILQRFTNDYILKLSNIHLMLPYISILTIIASYTTGLTIHYAFEKVLQTIRSKKKRESENQKLSDLDSKPSEFRADWSYYYAFLVMFRHLFISTIILGISLWLWFNHKSKPELAWTFLLTGITFSLIILIAYYKFKDVLKRLEENS